jgi:hypothetical protein
VNNAETCCIVICELQLETEIKAGAVKLRTDFRGFQRDTSGEESLPFLSSGKGKFVPVLNELSSIMHEDVWRSSEVLAPTFLSSGLDGTR